MLATAQALKKLPFDDPVLNNATFLKFEFQEISHFDCYIGNIKMLTVLAS